MDLIVTAKNIFIDNQSVVGKVKTKLNYNDIKSVVKCNITNIFFIMSKDNKLYAINGGNQMHDCMVVLEDHKSTFINVVYSGKTQNLKYPLCGSNYILYTKVKHSLCKYIISVVFTQKDGLLYESNVLEKH